MKPSKGNRCSHNKTAWRTTLARPFRPDQPPVLHITAETFARRLYWNPEAFPELAQAQQDLFKRTNRFRRSELREAMVLVFAACLLRMDVRSRRVGWTRRGGRDFQGLPRKTIANWIQRHESSVSRALEVFRYAGWISGPGQKGPNIVPQPVERCDDTPEHRKICPGKIERTRKRDGAILRGCHGLPAVRQISRYAFERLGTAGLLDSAVEHKDAAEEASITPLPSPSGDAPARSVVRLVGTLAAKKAIERPPDG